MHSVDQPGSSADPDPRRWMALALLAVAYFVVVLDATIVNVALPSIGRSLTPLPAAVPARTHHDH
jgi:hypothetical protein